ncbi:P-loop containing nucleoside triphosphate hydrolase protein [Exidia glandulosa HHB12029]|uniref:p-loop containing nucleoside triphosphate hydrolase protein n=1 Tax=Exidia glandulosa HHB12029 TaxID=1314781 RepID=A0A165GCE0_EXIGL|nr:P-loop containing nucleoside triphosphate hydrolase protein [Exidia glandulosa HHB12029]
MDVWKNSTLSAGPLGAALDSAYSAYEAILAVMLSLRFVVAYVVPLFHQTWFQDGFRLLLLGSVMETARRFWKKVADRVTESVFTTATFESPDFAFDWVDDYLSVNHAWGFLTAFRVTSAMSTQPGVQLAKDADFVDDAGHPVPCYEADADREEFWRWRGHWIKLSKKPGVRHWKTGEESEGVIRISVYSWKKWVLDALVKEAREHYIKNSKPRLIDDSGAKSEAVIIAHIEQPDRIFEWLCDFLGSANAWGNVRQLYVSSRQTGPSWGIDSSPELEVVKDEDMDDELLERLKKRPKVNYRPAADRPQLFKWKSHWVQVTRDQGSRDWRTGKEEGGKLTLILHNANRSILDDLIEASRVHFSKASQHLVTIYLADQYGSWSKTITKARRPLDTLILPNGVLELLLDDARDFMASEKWYRTAGVPHRRGYLLYGMPGTGKSSTIHALASELMLPIYSISLATKGMDDSALQNLVAETPPECILSIEDIDCAFPEPRSAEDLEEEEEGFQQERAARRRARQEDAEAQGAELPEEILDQMEGAMLPPRTSDVTLSGLLNLIDGVWSEEGRLLFATTNHIEKLDPALIRPGRIDVKISYTASTRDQAARLFERFFPPESYPSTSGTGSSADVPRLSSAYVSVSAPSRAADLDVPRAFLNKDEVHKLAEEFAAAIPEHKFSAAALQGFLLLWKSDPLGAVSAVREFVDNSEKEEKERDDARRKAAARRKARRKQDRGEDPEVL